MLFQGMPEIKPLGRNFDRSISNIKFEQHVGKSCLLSA